MQARSRRLDVLETNLRSGFFNQGLRHVLNPIKLGVDESMIAEKVDDPWNPVRMDVNRFYCFMRKD
jgi:hypothetical protein